MSGHRPGWPVCAYYEPDREGRYPGAPADAVFSDAHDAGEGPLYFFVPVAGGCAVRVAVCERHEKILARQARAREEMDALARWLRASAHDSRNPGQCDCGGGLPWGDGHIDTCSRKTRAQKLERLADLILGAGPDGEEHPADG